MANTAKLNLKKLKRLLKLMTMELIISKWISFSNLLKILENKGKFA